MEFFSKATFITILLLASMAYSQKLEVEGMTISWLHDDEEITFTVTAPDDGWVALGFNTDDNIVNTNLIMARVDGDLVDSEEFYVVGVGNPKNVAAIGSKVQHTNISGFEKDGHTTIKFTMPAKSVDNKHYNLNEGSQIWLICAFSMEDEFDHHSRMRKHVKVTL